MSERCTLTLDGTTASITFHLRRSHWNEYCATCGQWNARTLTVEQVVVTNEDGESTSCTFGDTLYDLLLSGRLALCHAPNCWQVFAQSLRDKGLTWTPAIVLRQERRQQRRISDLGIPLTVGRLPKSLRKHIRELKAKRRHASTHGPRMAEARRWLTSHGYPLPVLPPHPGQAARLEARERTRIAASKAEQARREQLAYERRQAEIAERSARLRDLENEEREFATGRRGYTRRYYSPLY